MDTGSAGEVSLTLRWTTARNVGWEALGSIIACTVGVTGEGTGIGSGAGWTGGDKEVVGNVAARGVSGSAGDGSATCGLVDPRELRSKVAGRATVRLVSVATERADSVRMVTLTHESK